MHRGYSRIDEPLNLLANGQRWFRGVWRNAKPHGGSALVLGATPWLVRLCARQHRKVVAMDVNEEMLALADQQLHHSSNPLKRSSIHLEQENWMRVHRRAERFCAVVGDNAFTFIPFPNGWHTLGRRLAARMEPGAPLIIRFWSMPPGARPQGVTQVVRAVQGFASPTSSAIRAALLFSVWDPATTQIPTERALDLYLQHQACIDRLTAACPVGARDDLQTMNKYRGSKAVYYAPPLDAALAVLREHFRITAVHYGPYSMAEYFPLVVAVPKAAVATIAAPVSRVMQSQLAGLALVRSPDDEVAHSKAKRIW
jgi:hypothetical protein